MNGNNPTPTEVTVTAVPIVVASTTADYFVLWVQHQCCPTNMDEVWVWTEPCRMIGFHNKANAGKEIQTHGTQ